MQTHPARNVHSFGPLVEANSTEGIAISTGYDLRPGEVRIGTVRIANASSRPASFRLAEDAASSDFGAGELTLEIAESDGEGSTLLFTGEFGDFPPEGIDIGSFEAGEERAYRFTLSCSVDALGSRLDRVAGAVYEWTAVPGEAQVP
ncbi:MAG TPA: hypothetical protein VFY48_01930 [Solirubrobacterales bacterium]|nr:hypothetical protein [Solirubrobacterales bacterium]